MDRKEYRIMTNKNLGPDLGPHASRVLPPTAGETIIKTLGAHASSVPSPTHESTTPGPHTSRMLPTATKKSATTNKARKAARPAWSFPHDPTLNRDDITAVSRLQNSRRKSSPSPKSSATHPKVNTDKAPEFDTNKNWERTARTARTASQPTYRAEGFCPGHYCNSSVAIPGTPNGTRSRFSTEKSVNNSANSASTAKPTSEGNAAFAQGYQWASKRGKHATEKSVNNSGNSGGIQTNNGDAAGSEKGRPTQALKPRSSSVLMLLRRAYGRHPRYNFLPEARRADAGHQPNRIVYLGRGAIECHAFCRPSSARTATISIGCARHRMTALSFVLHWR
jgi:hypothetical protein